MWSQFNEHFTTILNTVPACYRSLLHEAVNKFYRAVMAQAESFRKRPDGGTTSHRQPSNGQEHLVLLGFNSLRTSGFFTQVQELADAIAKLGKLPVPRCRYLSAALCRRNFLAAWNHQRHLILISYHDATHLCRKANVIKNPINKTQRGVVVRVRSGFEAFDGSL
jgi:hypothetical protein